MHAWRIWHRSMITSSRGGRCCSSVCRSFALRIEFVASLFLCDQLLWVQKYQGYTDDTPLVSFLCPLIQHSTAIDSKRYRYSDKIDWIITTPSTPSNGGSGTIVNGGIAAPLPLPCRMLAGGVVKQENNTQEFWICAIERGMNMSDVYFVFASIIYWDIFGQIGCILLDNRKILWC